MKPTPTPEMIAAYIIAKESADRRLYGFHNLGRHFILDGTTEVWFTASDDYEVGHAAMMAQLERSRVEAGLSAALSVQPAEAVVGEPEPMASQIILMSARGDIAPISAADALSIASALVAPSAPDGWQPIETAPHACHVIACYFYECEWIYDVVLSPPSPPFTHWKMLPAPPAGEKFWPDASEYDENAQVLGVRRCGKAVELWEASEWNDDHDRVPKPEYAGQKMFVMDGSSYAASLYTAADFFCAHFEQKEVASESSEKKDDIGHVFSDQSLNERYRVDSDGIIWDRVNGENVSEWLRRKYEALKEGK